MQFDDFYTLFVGTGANFDNASGTQCEGLVNYWSRAIGGQRFTGAFAYMIADQAGDFYERIENTPEAVPQKGDIIVWAADFNGGAGHTGISTGVGDTNSFEVFEANDPIGAAAEKKTYDYAHVVCFLRPKTLPQDYKSNLAACLTQHTQLVDAANQKDVAIGDLNNQLTTTEARVTELQNQVETLQTAARAAQNHITELEAQVTAQGTPDPATEATDLTTHTPTLSALIAEIRKLLGQN